MNSQPIAKFIACICCGARWVERVSESPQGACLSCFSSGATLENIYSEEIYQALKNHAQRIPLSPEKQRW